MIERVDQAAALLVETRLSGRKLDAWPLALEPVDAIEALAIQQAVAHRLGARIGGWKVALFADGTGLAAPILGPDIRTSPATLRLVTAERVGIEAEIGFTIGRTLQPLGAGKSYDRTRIIDAVAGVSAAIEIVESRFQDIDRVSKPAFLADNLGNGGLVHAPVVTGWSSLDLARIPVTVRLDGETLISRHGGHPLGDPLAPLVWLANHLARAGIPLATGQIVITGSFTGLHTVQKGQSVEVQFDDLGRVALDLSP